MNIIRDDYFLWLLNRIDVGYVEIDDYIDLLAFLYDFDFTWELDLDANLASRGLDLRYEFDPNMDLGMKNCSVLEALVALAWYWEHDITYDYQIGDRSGLWFWLMIENLGLLEYQNWRFDESGITGKLVWWLERKFDYSGNGSPFPLKNAKRDQRNLIIWLQVNDYVMENVKI